MNRIEKWIYDRVKNTPAVKFVLRNAYQMAFDILPTPSNESMAPIEARPGYFYGFHDRSPFAADERKVLAHRLSIPLRMPAPGEGVGIGYFDFDPSGVGKLGTFHQLGESLAWNYHKGCRLQWLDEGHIVFNTFRSGKLVAVVLDTQGKETALLPRGIDTVSADGKWATSFSYERLHQLMPGYGYDGVEDDGCLDQQIPEKTGLYLVGTASGDVVLIASLLYLSRLDAVPGMEKMRHFVTHTEFSPDGRYISFLHRWVGEDYRRRHSRIGIYDCYTSAIRFLPTTGMVSHYVWQDDLHLLAYCSIKEGDAHVSFHVETGDCIPVCLGTLNVDGHQSMWDANRFITDTYPDRRRMASLYAVDMKEQAYRRIAYLYSPRRFQTKDFHAHIACDLHPRVSPSGRFVCFDSVYTGERSLCVMPLNQL